MEMRKGRCHPPSQIRSQSQTKAQSGTNDLIGPTYRAWVRGYWREHGWGIFTQHGWWLHRWSPSQLTSPSLYTLPPPKPCAIRVDLHSNGWETFLGPQAKVHWVNINQQSTGRIVAESSSRRSLSDGDTAVFLGGLHSTAVVDSL